MLFKGVDCCYAADLYISEFQVCLLPVLLQAVEFHLALWLTQSAEMIVQSWHQDVVEMLACLSLQRLNEFCVSLVSQHVIVHDEIYK